MQSYADISQILDTQYSRDDVLRELIQHQHLPDGWAGWSGDVQGGGLPGRRRGVLCRRRVCWCVEIEQRKESIGLGLLQRLGRRLSGR